MFDGLYHLNVPHTIDWIINLSRKMFGTVKAATKVFFHIIAIMMTMTFLQPYQVSSVKRLGFPEIE